jgi:hypothetical protein
MTRGRSTIMGFGGFTGFGSRRFSNVRCGFTSRASAAISLIASRKGGDSCTRWLRRACGGYQMLM